MTDFRNLRAKIVIRDLKEVELGNFCLTESMNLNENGVERTCEANSAGENSSIICTACVKSVSLYHFKLECVVLHMTVKEVFGSHL